MHIQEPGRVSSLGLVSVFVVGVLASGCAAVQHSATPEEAAHLGEGWFEHRASTLGLTVAETKNRDAQLPGVEGPPPHDALDEHTRREAAVLWRDLCAGCHGMDGTPPPTPEGQPEPRSWGVGSRMGFTFGGDKMRQGLYKSIAEGKPPAMPAWGVSLSKEQVWALVQHLEGF